MLNVDEHAELKHLLTLLQQYVTADNYRDAREIEPRLGELLTKWKTERGNPHGTY
jgi:hypothetical protein